MSITISKVMTDTRRAARWRQRTANRWVLTSLATH